MPLYTTTCAICGRPLVLPFESHRPKLCEVCSAPRSPEEIEAADRDNLRLRMGVRARRTGGRE